MKGEHYRKSLSKYIQSLFVLMLIFANFKIS